MKALIQNGIVVEILQALPGHAIEDCFHPSILLQCVDFKENMEVSQPLPIPQPEPEPLPIPQPEPEP